MKVGTDGVLLGAWCGLPAGACRLLDIGTGTGLIALMLAQRADRAQITAIDIDPVEEAQTNVARSPWSDRITLVQCAVQQFEAAPFDRIVSNPPFFTESLKCPDRGRTMARHAVALPFEELLEAVCRLLKPDGRFALVLPTTEGERFEQLAAGRLTTVRRTEVSTTPRHAPKRLLLEMMHTAAATECLCERLTIGTGEHETYTEEYRRLTRDFYLKF